MFFHLSPVTHAPYFGSISQIFDIKPIKTSIGDIYPARGIVKTEDGRVILTAYPTDNIDTRTPYGAANYGKI